MGIFGLGNNVDTDILAKTPIFQGFSADELKAVAKLARRREVSAGDRFIEQGRFGDACYVISEGNANVFFGGTYVTTVTEGSAVGEMALMERRPRNATVVADTDMVLAEFAIEDFRKLLDLFPAAKLRVEELLNRRLLENATGVDASEQNTGQES